MELLKDCLIKFLLETTIGMLQMTDNAKKIQVLRKVLDDTYDTQEICQGFNDSLINCF
jgi:hypothetical protein